MVDWQSHRYDIPGKIYNSKKLSRLYALVCLPACMLFYSLFPVFMQPMIMWPNFSLALWQNDCATTISIACYYCHSRYLSFQFMNVQNIVRHIWCTWFCNQIDATDKFQFIYMCIFNVEWNTFNTCFISTFIFFTFHNYYCECIFLSFIWTFCVVFFYFFFLVFVHFSAVITCFIIQKCCNWRSSIAWLLPLA